jgi:hypothetical protein
MPSGYPDDWGGNGAALLHARCAPTHPSRVIWDPILSLARSLDLPASISVPDIPDLPKWLMFLLGKGKYILIAVIVAMAARRRPLSKRESP